MKYSEFKAEVEKMGYEVSILENYIYIQKNNRTYAKVSKTSRYVIDTHYGSFLALYESDAFKIYEACMMLTETPLAEREEEKRYYLRLATKIDVYEDRRYLNMDIPNEKYTLSENKDDAYYKAIFTETEISQMDITGFEKVEVTE